MRNLAILVACLMASTASAQLMLLNVENSAGSAAPSFPGDLATPWYFWGGLRAYSLAKRGTRAINACDAGNVCADVNSDATTGELPASIIINGTNCSGGGCNVKIVYDQTGNNNCSGATPCDFSQTGTINLRPTLQINCINTTKWCLSFAGTQAGQLMATPAISGPAQPMTQSFIVFATATQQEYAPDTVSGFQVRHSSTANLIEVFEGSLSSATITDNAWNAVQIVWHGSGSNFLAFINGSSTPLSNTGTSPIQAQTIAGGFSIPCTCKMTEFGLFNGDSSSMRTAINGNQRTWGGF